MRNFGYVAMKTSPFQTVADPTQDEVFRFLGAASTFGGAQVQRCDTHAAVVFLAGDRALKIKRAVRFPFLDYSTLQKRKVACEAELEVNRRFAPSLYRRIVPITRQANGALMLDGDGTPVEWAVEMVRFDENKTLDRLADRGAFDEALPKKLAVLIAVMHAGAARSETGPWLMALENYIGQNTAAFLRRDSLFIPREVEELDQRTRAALARLRPLLLARGRQGFIQRGHGDLHLGNIAMLDGQPVAFDAIEFDPVIASGDVLYDLAFLLMDLVERGFTRAANEVLNDYFATTRRVEHCDALAALPFFMSMRAAIRAKVTAARIQQVPKSQSAEVCRSAARYFKLARHLLEPTVPRIVCTGGLSGTGKSLLARCLAPLLPPPPGALVLRSDVERKALFGVGETEHLPSDAYQQHVSAEVYAVLNDKAHRAVGAGYPVVVDAVFAKPSERAGIQAVAREANVEFLGLFLVADLDTRLRRIGGRGPDASEATADVAHQQEGFEIGQLDWTLIDASGSPEQTLTRARAVVDALLAN